MKIKLDQGAIEPIRAHTYDAGLDLYAPNSVTISSHTPAFIDTGVHVEIPEGYVGFVKSRSSLLKKGIITDGTIDSGYTGSIGVVLFSMYDRVILAGERIAQLVIVPCLLPEIEIVDELDSTERGAGGFGSTGK